MTTLTYSIANTHDHWNDEPAIMHAGALLRLCWRHLERRHPLVATGLEWCGAGALSIALLAVQLVVNA